MPNKHWIVVGNGARAMVFSRDPGKVSWFLTREAEYEHAESRMKGSDLVSDRPGGVKGHGNESTMFTSRTDPKRNAVEHFAHEVAEHLDKAHRHGKFSRLTLVASNPFLGLLGGELTQGVKACVDKQIVHDYTRLEGRELEAQLKQAMTLR